MSLKLFISYSRRDFPFVRDFVRSLREAGMDLWLDVANIRGGERWNASIEAALNGCTHCLVIVSPYSMKSAAVAREINFATEHQKAMIPVLLQTTPLSEKLQSIQWVDFRVSFEKALRVLLARLRGEARSAVEEWLDTPPHRSHMKGFVPIAYVICPRPVKVISLLVGLSVSFKLFGGLVCTMLHREDSALVGWTVVIMTGFCLWWDYRAVNRRVTFTEALGMQCFMILIPFFGLLADRPILFLLLGIPVDLALLVAMLASKTYRRWMTAYPYGAGWTD
jgi:hypothetical protein